MVGGLLGRVFWVLSSWQETPRHTVPRTPGKGFNFHRPLEHLRVLPQELKKVAGGRRMVGAPLLKMLPAWLKPEPELEDRSAGENLI